MRITFVLPGFITAPMGGVKVVIEYANRLAARGHQVTLLYPLRLQSAPLYYLKRFLWRYINQSDRLYYQPAAPVDVLAVRELTAKYLPAAEVLVACGWQTAQAVAAAPAECGRKFYLLQSFETYFRRPGRIIATYHLPLTKIAIAGWIIEELAKIQETAYGPLGNAINPEEFFQEAQPERTYDVIFIYHHRRIKGAATGLRVLRQLKRRQPSCQAVIVAPRKPLHRLPAWCELVIQPTVAELRQLYNRSKVLLFTSKWEGWGLPPMEALACGCAVVAVANRGVQEYLRDRENALLCEPDNVTQLVDRVASLLNDPALRQQLVERGRQTIGQYSWDEIITRFEQYLQ